MKEEELIIPGPVEPAGGVREPSRLEAAIEAGKAQGKLALYFGCWDTPGHYLHKPGGLSAYDAKRTFPGFPWSEAHMDGGLLHNGNRPDVVDGKVFWTCGGLSFWYAFYWWDRSGDRRGASNSGFYVRGFGFPEEQAAFDYACAQFPHIVKRQTQPLVIQPKRGAPTASPARKTVTDPGMPKGNDQ